MAYDRERTKRLAREAAIAEFAEHGQHGTTMDRIAQRAGVNKERVYSYFGNKASLFTAVVREEIEKFASAVPLCAGSLEEIGEFAGHTFDYLQEHPDIARLVIWEGMSEAGQPADHDAARDALYKDKAAVIRAAQQAGVVDGALDPGHLVFLLLAIANWWAASPQIARMLSRANRDDRAERARRRASVVDAAIRLARPDPPAALAG